MTDRLMDIFSQIYAQTNKFSIYDELNREIFRIASYGALMLNTKLYHHANKKMDKDKFYNLLKHGNCKIPREFSDEIYDGVSSNELKSL